jgi:UDP-GlcNAc:undecaprenyl-phosphate/decaprenyl-phosphate GlcNAc-1-phosphate transferase
VQFLYLPVPGKTGALSLGTDLAVPLTVLFVVVTINAVNFIDGLDGLAAGVVGIASMAFFAYSYELSVVHHFDRAAAPTLLTAALTGACAGFLPHNFNPARVFMGDSGSMLVGLMLSAAATTATTSTDPQTFEGALGSIPLMLPLLIPLAVLIVPIVDLLLAVFRRVRHGQSPFSPDKQHLHHRLLKLGHSHRRAVLLLYFWTALLAFGGVGFSIFHGPWVLVAVLVGGVALGILVSVRPQLGHHSGLPAAVQHAP